MTETRIEQDSMGTMSVPADALYGAQTARALENFPISGLRFPRPFLRALGMIKEHAARVNRELGLLDERRALAIMEAAEEVVEGALDEHFVLDIFQTGSGTSSNMNAHEVIAALAGTRFGARGHPNDHVNMSQSSNDCFPTAIHIAAALEITHRLIPALTRLRGALRRKTSRFSGIIKIGRTHLMDAMPVTFGQEISGWAAQLRHGIERIHAALPRVRAIVQGGTAVGTGINAPADFGPRVAAALAAPAGPAEQRWAADGPARLVGPPRWRIELTFQVAMRIVGSTEQRPYSPAQSLEECNEFATTIITGSGCAAPQHLIF